MRISRSCVYEKYPISKHNIRVYSFIVDICQEVSQTQCKFIRVFLLNPKGMFEIGKEAKPSSIMQAGIKMFVGPQVAQAIAKSLKKREKDGYNDELKVIQCLNDNRELGVSM